MSRRQFLRPSTARWSNCGDGVAWRRSTLWVKVSALTATLAVTGSGERLGRSPGVGALFGLAFDPSRGVYFVDDNTNTLNLLH